MFSRFSGIAVLILIVVVAGSAQSTISGRLLKADGKPLAWTEIEMVPITASKFVDDPRLNTISDARGNFKFADLPRAKYTLSINFGEAPSELSPYEAFFFPNATNREDAQVFDLSTATVTNNLVFKLPPALRFLTISGTVRTGNGVVASNVFVAALRDADNRIDGFGMRAAGSAGDFSLSLIAGRKYRIVASQFEDMSPFEKPKVIGMAISETFLLDKSRSKFDLKLIPNPTREQIRMIIGQGEDISMISRPVFPFGD